MNISDLKKGRSAVITEVGGEGALRQHFLDLGLIPGSTLKMLGAAPMGDPLEIFTHGYSLSLRKDEAAMISIREIEGEMPNRTPSNDNFGYNLTLHEHNAHPGFGEEGKYHRHGNDTEALPRDAPMTFALVGQKNSGKTALFNSLTGASGHVGNFPGVTMEKMEGVSRGHSNVRIVDLPGICSLSPFTSEEKITRDFIIEGKPECIINVADAGNIERHLYLTVQLIELGIPVVLALNMIDEIRGNGGSIRVNEMERMLGIPVVAISSSTGEGVEELMRHAVHIARHHETPAVANLCPGDRSNADNLAKLRYDFIDRLCSWTVKRPDESREYLRSRRMDRILTGRWTAIPIFIAVMVLTIYLSVDAIGYPLQELLGKGIGHLAAVCASAMENAAVAPAVRSLVIDGIFGGVGTVLGFIPVIILLFFFLSLLEDSGYMARVAFVTDKLLRRVGLSGRSIVPLLIGFGCSVPAVLAARTLPSSRDRRMTILLTPFISCPAKIPVYAFISSAFFPGHGGLVLVCLYLLGVSLGVVVALLRKWLAKDLEPAPFVMEMPNYRLPRLQNVAHLLWDKTKDFLGMVFTVIFVASIVIWALKSFDWRFNFVQDGSESMLAAISGWMVPLFRPLGLGDWRIVTAFISGFLAKEGIAATMQVLGVSGILTAATAVPALVFTLLYTPCVATITAIKRELGLWWALFVIVFQCVVAWLASYVIYQIVLALL